MRCKPVYMPSDVDLSVLACQAFYSCTAVLAIGPRAAYLVHGAHMQAVCVGNMHCIWALKQHDAVEHAGFWSLYAGFIAPWSLIPWWMRWLW